MVGGRNGVRTGGDAEHFSIRLETPQVVEYCLKTTFVAEISGIKVPEKGDLFWLLSVLFHIDFFSRSAASNYSEQRRDNAIWKRS
jgi:hypothetical protein